MSVACLSFLTLRLCPRALLSRPSNLSPPSERTDGGNARAPSTHLISPFTFVLVQSHDLKDLEAARCLCLTELENLAAKRDELNERVGQLDVLIYHARQGPSQTQTDRRTDRQDTHSLSLTLALLPQHRGLMPKVPPKGAPTSLAKHKWQQTTLA